MNYRTICYVKFCFLAFIFRIVSAVRLMESFDDNDHKMRPILHVANSLISLLRNRVADTALYNSSKFHIQQYIHFAPFF